MLPGFYAGPKKHVQEDKKNKRRTEPIVPLPPLFKVGRMPLRA